MSTQMSDPHNGLLSFQEGLKAGFLEIGLVHGHRDLYSHYDVPVPGGGGRMTYVRLSDDRKTVKALLSCVENGKLKDGPIYALGYAVAEPQRNQGLAKAILKDVLEDMRVQIGKVGRPVFYAEVVIGVDNEASLQVAEAVFTVPRDSITDPASGLPAYRYTVRIETGKQKGR